jgi:hypothetical protein
MKQKRGQKRKGRLHNQTNNALGFVAAIPNYYFETLCSLSTVFETVGRFIVRVPAIHEKSLRSVFYGPRRTGSLFSIQRFSATVRVNRIVRPCGHDQLVEFEDNPHAVSKLGPPASEISNITEYCIYYFKLHGS